MNKQIKTYLFRLVFMDILMQSQFVILIFKNNVSINIKKIAFKLYAARTYVHFPDASLINSNADDNIMKQHKSLFNKTR